VPAPPALFRADGFGVTVGVPNEARELERSELPQPDVSRLPGASIIALRGWDGGDAIVRAGCVRGPSSRFAPGIEEVLFEKATWLTLTRAGVEPASVRLLSSENGERSFLRVLGGRDGEKATHLEHLIVFAGDDRDVILCSALCRGPAAICEEGTATLAIEGSSAPLPRPSLLVQSALWAAGDPTTALGVVAGAAVLVIVVLLWKRPYPRP
jgi:hypothetical protein